MAGVCHQLFAGAGFTANQQRRINQRHARRALLELANGGRLAQDGLKAASAVVLQGAQALTQALRRVQGEHGAGHGATGVVQGHGFQQVALAANLHLAGRQAVALVDEGLRQGGVAGQGLQRHAGQLRLGHAAGQHGGGVGHHNHATPVHRQHGVGLRGQQGVQVQATARAGQHFKLVHSLHARHLEQLAAQRGHVLRAQGRGFEVDVGRVNLNGRHIQRAARQGGQYFVGNAHPVGKVNIDTHD